MIRKYCAMLAAITILCINCGEDNPESPNDPPAEPVVTVDTIPPAAITGAIVTSITHKSVALVWNAPGDDGNEGTAAEYDIRYDDVLITEANWESAVQFDDEPAPKPAGDPETVRILNLSPVTTYYFGIKSRDDEGNESDLSDIASGTTAQETQAPAPVTDLFAESVGENSFELQWTAPGDDGIFGQASEYDIRCNTSPIDETNWKNSTVLAPTPAPSEPGSTEVFRIDELSGLDNYYFAIKTADEVPNWSPLSNVPFAIGGQVDLFVPDRDIHSGEMMTVYFRSPGDQQVTIRLHKWAIAGCEYPAGTHPWVIADIVRATMYTEGLRSVRYNFTASNGDYLESATYYVVMCWGGVRNTYVRVTFTNDS